MFDHSTTLDVPSSHASSYALGPIGPTHLLTLQARLSDGLDISLLVPAHLPLSLLSDTQFKDGYEWGCLRADIEEGWTVPHMVNYIYLTLRTEFYGECSLSTSAWAVGFLLGNLTGLAETERTLALVGIAHLRFLLVCVSLDVWLSDSFHCCLIQQMDSLHRTAIRTYRARVRLSREQGMSFSEAQFLLEDARNLAGISQQQLADELGVSFVTVARWEAGRQTPESPFIGKLCQRFRVKHPRDLNLDAEFNHTCNAPHCREDELLTMLELFDRRQLIALFSKLSVLTGVDLTALFSTTVVAPDELLNLCRMVIDQCWSLLEAGSLVVADTLLSECLAKLDGLATKLSPFQSQAATLATEALILQMRVATHNMNFARRVKLGSMAVRYGELSGDTNVHIMAIGWYGDTYASRHYQQPDKAIDILGKAVPLFGDNTRLNQADISVSLANAYALDGNDTKSRDYLAQAHMAMPEHPTVDPLYRIILMGQSELDQREGDVYLILAQRFPTKEYGQLAYDSLVKAENQPSMSNNLTGKKLILKAEAALLINDKDDYLDSLMSGAHIALQVNSQKQISKAVIILQKAPRSWRTEQKYIELRKLLTPSTIVTARQ